MPASPQSPGTAGSIVLVEEYGALAVAIGSALKKFAPGFSTRTVRSLADAQSAIADVTPDLLVIDFDPPPQGAVEFFTRLKTTAPSTRVLVIAAAPLGGLTAKLTAVGAFEFVEKPFDLKTLGAGVEAVLGTGGTAGRPARTLRNLGVRDLVPLQCIAGATGVLKVDGAEGRTGEIHFIDGRLSHAETSELDGPEALEEMLRWRSPRFKQPKRRPRVARTLEGHWATVLFAAIDRVGEVEELPPDSEPQPDRLQGRGGGKKIVVIDDTEMLLVFVEDSLATADPTLEITMASTGAAGVERVQSVRPDLVLLDYSLPDFNGDEVCKRLLTDPQTAATPVIMMSGHVPEMTASAVRYENIVATIAKPFRSDALINIVTRALAEPAQFAVRAPAETAVTPPLPPTTKESDREQAKPVKNGNGHRRAPVPAPVAAAEPTAAPSQAPAPPAPAAPPTPKEANTPQPPQDTRPAAAAPPPEDAPQPPPSASLAIQAPAATPLLSAVVPPPPPIPVIAPPPTFERTTNPSIVAEPRPALAIAPSPARRSSTAPALGLAPARIVATPTNTVIVGIALDVLAIQFSRALQIASIRARAASRTVSLHVEPGALPGMNLPEAGFELGPVDLDARGQIQTIRLLPTAERISTIPPHHAFPVGGVSVLPWNGGKAVELTPAAAAPMLMHLSAPFDLAGVELSPTFGVGALVLTGRGGEFRVSLDRERARSGAAFKTAQVLLDRSAQLAEIVLDAVAESRARSAV